MFAFSIRESEMDEAGNFWASPFNVRRLKKSTSILPGAK